MVHAAVDRLAQHGERLIAILGRPEHVWPRETHRPEADGRHRERAQRSAHIHRVLRGVGKTDEVGARERTADLLHLAAGDQVAEVDGEEARVVEQGADLGLRISVVA